MAQLHPKVYELPPLKHRDESGNYVDFRSTEHHKAFEELRTKHDMIYFGVADGSACYIVKSRKPLVLQHVDYCDGYAASHALIRGLRLKEVEQMLEPKRTASVFPNTPIFTFEHLSRSGQIP